jgi:hypothetical protein
MKCHRAPSGEQLVGKVAGRKIEFRDSTPEAFELE